MKNKKTEEKKLNDLTPEMKERIMMMESQLADLRNNKQVTEQTIKELDNLVSELLIMRSLFVSNIINWTKQGYFTE
jgi:hypothetical protein|tara:strand:- start:2438 stop:2665 length:228 start_codon:yes stop_codon:yes gene_type:complete